MDSKQAYYEEKRGWYAGISHEPSASPSVIASMIPEAPPSLRVLDLGCAGGAVGAVVRARGHGVCGVEISPGAAEAARKVLNEVHVGDLESGADLPWPKDSFDALVFADVLEHLVDPPAAVRRFLPYLKPSGIVVISVPNFGFFKIRLRFLTNRVMYEPSGILDEGHLRIFNDRLLRKLVADSGLELDLIRGAGSVWARKLPFPVGDGALFGFLYGGIERPVKSALRDLLYSQLVARAHRP